MKKFKRRLDTAIKLVTIEGVDNIPLNPDGTVVFGTYTIYYVWRYDGITVRKPRTLEFRPADNRIEFRKNGVVTNQAETITIISSQSTNPYYPTAYSLIDTSFPSNMTCHYVERDINDNITLDVDITNTVTVNTSLVENSVTSDKLSQGVYVFYYEVEYNNGSTTYNKSLVRPIESVTYTIPDDETPLYTFQWENLPLPVINKDVGDAFPSISEMTDIIPIGVLTETATGDVTRLATTYLTPTEPEGGVSDSSTYLIKFMATNLLSGSSGDTGLSDDDFNTYVIPQIKTRTIQYNIVTQNPQPVPIEITFSPSTLDDVVFQDFESGSNPVPLSYENGGLFPSEADLLSGVTATYIDADEIVQSLSITLTRPTGSLYAGALKDHLFNNGEVIMSIPKTWPIEYEAEAPDGTKKTIVRNVVIEDTIAPVISQAIPTTMEKGTGYGTWLNREINAFDYPRFDYNDPAPKSNVLIEINITEQEFAALDDGDTFTTTYTAIDNSANTTIVAQVTTCEDTISPALAFNSTLTFPTGSNPTDEELKVGAITSDFSEPIVLTVDDSGVNYSAQGFYTASYTATDAHGNSRIRTRNIFVKDGVSSTPPGPNPPSCPQTPGVPNIYLDGTEVIANITDDYWLDGLFAQQAGEDITFNIVISQDSIDALPTTAQGTLDYDNNDDGWIDVEVTPLYINYEIQDENGTPIICTTRYIETIDILAPTIYDVPNPILVYKQPNDPVTGQSDTIPNDVITEIVSKINVIDNVDGTGFITATLEGIGQGDINTGDDIVRTLRFTDSEGNESRYVTTIQFTDNMHPTITLLGDNPLTLTSSVLPADPGATATDPEDGALAVTSDWDTVMGSTASQGTYNINYTATDSEGVVVEETRQVIVPYLDPSITLLGDNPYTLYTDPETQVDPFAEAFSVLDGDITSNIVSDWDTYINASTPEGSYTITYSVTDSTGTTVTTTRTVVYEECILTAPSQYWDGTSTDSQVGSNSVSLGGAALTTINGKYDSDSFNFGASGEKQPILFDTDIDLSSGVYTFSLWFYNMRSTSGHKTVLRRTSGTNPSNTSQYPILILNQAGNSEIGVNVSAGNFFSSGYSMSSFAGDTSWNHLAVVADGSDSIFYVNGSQVGSAVNHVITDSAGELGSYDGNDTLTFAEGIDEFAYWNSALEACEISQIYNSSQKLAAIIPPAITLLGVNPYEFSENPGSQVDPGATAYSLLDGDITSNVVSDWDTYINASTIYGTYTVTYSITDSLSRTATTQRQVSYVSCFVYYTLPSLYFDGSSVNAINSLNDVSLTTGNGTSNVTLSVSNGKYGSDSFKFATSGTSKPIQLGEPIDLSSSGSNGTYTFSLWFYNMRDATGYKSLLRRAAGPNPSATTQYPILIEQTTNEIGLTNSGGGSFNSTGFAMDSYNGLSSWTHLAVVADGTDSTFYINGQQVGNVVNEVVEQPITEIGSYSGDGTQTFAEGIDEFAYWDVALDPCEIEQIYDSSVSLFERNLIEFEESRLTTLYGNASLNNGILELDGTDDYAVYGGDFRYTDNFSISIWFKTRNASISDPYVIASCHDAGGVSNGTSITLFQDGELRVRFPDSGVGTNGVADNLGAGLVDANWHHIVVTWQASTTNGRKVYIDGQLEHQSNCGVATAYRTTPQSLFYLGAVWNYATSRFNSANFFDGYLDDFRMVRKVLSSTDVTDIYNSTSGSHQ